MISRLNQPVVDPLVVPLPVIMSGVLTSRFPKRPFPEEDHPVEAFILDRSDEPLGVGVQVGRTRRQADDLDPGALQQIDRTGRYRGGTFLTVYVLLENRNRLTMRDLVSPLRI